MEDWKGRKMKILVTGGAGFIGSQVVDAYVAEGHQVIIIDNLVTGKRRNLNQQARFYQMDIRDPSVEKVFAQERPEVISHHAAQMDVRKSVQDPLADADTNILGMLNLLEKARLFGVKRFIFASSGGAIYGDQPEGSPSASEDDPLHPMSAYGAAKASGELYLNFYHIVHGLNYMALRYGNVYGPRQDPFGEAGVVAIFIKNLLGGHPPVINGDGLQTRDYVFVEDVVRANLLALAPNVSGSINIGTGIGKNVIELFEELRNLTGRSASEAHGPGKPGEQRRSVLNWTKAKMVLGWTPKILFTEGLRRTVEYFINKSIKM
jgi:UDP-glucose 4-epimerase